MQVITLDFETFYSKEFSLSKMSTQQYLDDPRYETIGVAVKVNDGPTEWCSSEDTKIKDFLFQFDWKNSLLVAHHTLFDASILAWKYGTKPKMMADTLSMGRAIHGTEVGGSLKALAEYYGLGVKGTEVLDALGKRRLDFSDEELNKYGAYCINDVELTYKLFKKLAPKFGTVEAKLIDMTIRMHTEPKLVLNLEVLEDHLHRVQKRKGELLEAAGIAKEDLMSNPKFAEILKQFGIEPPMKTSLTTGKETYAFAKTDQAMKDLLEHDNPDVQAIVAARVGTKSTIEETRTQRFIELCQTRYQLPVPLKYYGAMTGRWAATDKTNLQNIPRGSRLKDAIQAPAGCQIVGADLSNIELRVGLYFAGQMDKLQLLSSGVDLYKDFASSVFNVSYDDVNDEQRFIGKACVAEGEPVLTERGLIPIEKIKIDDRVWDGVEWVRHDGVVCMGEKDVIEYQGLKATPDHIVYLEDGSSCEFGAAAHKRTRIATTGDGRHAVKLLDDNQRRNKEEQQSRRSVIASALRLWVRKMVAPRVFYPWVIEKLPPMRVKAQPCWQGASHRGEPCSRITAKTGHHNNAKMQQPKQQKLFSLWWAWDSMQICVCEGISNLFKDFARLGLWQGDRQNRQQWELRDREFTICYAAGADKQPPQYFICELAREKYFSIRVERKPLHEAVDNMQVHSYGYGGGRNNSECLGISDKEVQKLADYKGKTRVYDIINAGPRHRFTVSNCLVSNCSLSLIYGTGHKKLRNSIKTMSGKDIGEAEAKRIVDIYRSDYSNVKQSWAQGERVLEAIRDNASMWFGLNDDLTLHVSGDKGLLLPSGIYLRYPDLKQHMNEEGRKQWTYAQRKERIGIHGAKCYQNTIQALARCVMGESMVRIAKKGPIALTIHDAVYCVVPDTFVDKAKRLIVTELKREPEWAPGLPLDAEVGAGQTLAFKMKKLEP